MPRPVVGGRRVAWVEGLDQRFRQVIALHVPHKQHQGQEGEGAWRRGGPVNDTATHDITPRHPVSQHCVPFRDMCSVAAADSTPEVMPLRHEGECQRPARRGWIPGMKLPSVCGRRGAEASVVFLTWVPRAQLGSRRGRPRGGEPATACASPFLGQKALGAGSLPSCPATCLRPATALTLVLGPLVEEQMCWSSRSSQRGAMPGPRGAKGRLGQRAQALGGVGGDSAVFVLEAESSLFFQKLGEKPISSSSPFVPTQPPSPGSLQAGGGCPRATTWESICVQNPPGAEASSDLGQWELRGGGCSQRWSWPQAAPNNLLLTHQCLPLFCTHPAASLCQSWP